MNMTKGMIMVLCGLGGIISTLIIAIVLLLSWEKRKKDCEKNNKGYGKRNTSNTNLSNNTSRHHNQELVDNIKLIEEDTVLLDEDSLDEDNTILLDDNSEETELLNEENISL